METLLGIKTQMLNYKGNFSQLFILFNFLNFLFITFDTIMENYQEDATEQITSLSCYDGFVY
jgi:hypothetical protein